MGDKKERRTRGSVKLLKPRMEAMEAQGKSRAEIARELGLIPAQVTNTLGAVRAWKDRRVERT